MALVDDQAKLLADAYEARGMSSMKLLFATFPTKTLKVFEVAVLADKFRAILQQKGIYPKLMPYDKPCAADGYLSYRYRSPLQGWIMLGAHSPEEALKEAERSLETGVADPAWLEQWDQKLGYYVPVSTYTCPKT